MKKKILMMCYKFSPDISVGSLRSCKFAQYLNKFGWSCEVLTATKGNSAEHALPESVHVTRVLSPNFTAWLDACVQWFNRIKRKTSGADRSSLAVNRSACAQVLKKAGGLGVATKIQRWLLLPDQQFLWIFTALPIALLKQRTCAVIYSSAWPVSTHIVAMLTHALTKKPWVADYRDEWTLNSQWQPPTRFHRWLGEYLDRSCVKHARFVVNVTEARTENFKRKYPAYAYKCVTIHNGYDENDIAPFRGRQSPDGYMLLTNLGSMYGGRDPDLFLQALQEVLDEDHSLRNELRIVSFNKEHAQLAAKIAVLKLSDVFRAFPRVSQHEAFEQLAKSHVALLFGSDMEKVAMTTKVYEYAGMGKLIFALVPDGPVKNFVTQCSGVVASPGDKVEIKAALQKLFEHYREGTLTNICVSDTAARYERSALTNQLAELLDRVIAPKAPGA